jgi:hypothetical protein
MAIIQLFLGKSNILSRIAFKEGTLWFCFEKSDQRSELGRLIKNFPIYETRQSRSYHFVAIFQFSTLIQQMLLHFLSDNLYSKHSFYYIERSREILRTRGMCCALRNTC